MRARTLIPTLGASLALVAAGAQAAAATTTTTNFWNSPTGNIGCRYYPTLETVTCETHNDGYSVAVNRYGSKGFRTYSRWIPSYAPVLVYGGHWTAPGLACISSTVGMACSTAAGHGFVINRTAVMLK